MVDTLPTQRRISAAVFSDGDLKAMLQHLTSLNMYVYQAPRAGRNLLLSVPACNIIFSQTVSMLHRFLLQHHPVSILQIKSVVNRYTAQGTDDPFPSSMWSMKIRHLAIDAGCKSFIGLLKTRTHRRRPQPTDRQGVFPSTGMSKPDSKVTVAVAHCFQ